MKGQQAREKARNVGLGMTGPGTQDKPAGGTPECVTLLKDLRLNIPMVFKERQFQAHQLLVDSPAQEPCWLPGAFSASSNRLSSSSTVSVGRRHKPEWLQPLMSVSLLHLFFFDVFQNKTQV